VYSDYYKRLNITKTMHIVATAVIASISVFRSDLLAVLCVVHMRAAVFTTVAIKSSQL